MKNESRKYPRVIDSGGGQRMTLLGPRHDGGREWMDVVSEIQPGAGPPMHVHPTQDESLTVLQGRIGYIAAGQEPRFAGPGESVTFPRGVAHRFWNAGDVLLRCEGHISPPLGFEYFMTALYRSSSAHGGKRPGLFDLAFLLHHFESENTMVGLPAPLRKGVLPVLRTIGKVTGRYEKYRDAPKNGEG
ncbi:MAG: cupin domain-containing protein [bacterium]